MQAADKILHTCLADRDSRLSPSWACAERFCRLQPVFSVVAVALAPHLRLARSEKALQATQLLLSDALALEQANVTAWRQQQQQQLVQQQGQHVASGRQLAPVGSADLAAAPTTLTGDCALRAQSTSSIFMDSIDIQPPAAAVAKAAAAAQAAATAEVLAGSQPLATWC